MIERDTEVRRVSHNLEMIVLESDLPLPLPIESLTIGEKSETFKEMMSYYSINT